MNVSFSRSPVAVALMIAIALAGCSSSGDDGPTPADGPGIAADGGPAAAPTGPSGDPGEAGGTDVGDSGDSGDAGDAGDADVAGAGTPFTLDGSLDGLITTLAGYRLETLSEQALLIGETVAAGAGAGTVLEPGSVGVDAFGERVVRPSERTRYDCPLGGTVVADVGRLVISESSYSNTADQDRYDFDQCRVETDGEQVLDGSVRVWDNAVSASRGGFSNRDVQWTDFSWRQGANASVAGDASIEIRQLLSVDDQRSRTVSIRRFEQIVDGAPRAAAADAELVLLGGTQAVGGLATYGLTIDGTVSDAAGVDVRLVTDTPFAASLAQPASGLDGEPLTGTLSASADNGARARVSAQPRADIGPKLVDIAYTAPDGSTDERTGVPFVELTIELP